VGKRTADQLVRARCENGPRMLPASTPSSLSPRVCPAQPAVGGAPLGLVSGRASACARRSDTQAASISLRTHDALRSSDRPACPRCLRWPAAERKKNKEDEGGTKGNHRWHTFHTHISTICQRVMLFPCFLFQSFAAVFSACCCALLCSLQSCRDRKVGKAQPSTKHTHVSAYTLCLSRVFGFLSPTLGNPRLLLSGSSVL
jgi:hypothetical protein